MSVINTNISSMQAQNSIRTSGLNLSSAMERLSSGVRINAARDDAAGLAISTRMTSEIRGMSMAIRNANDAISLTQTAEGSLGSIADNLQRMRELAVQSSNSSNSASDRVAMQSEVKQLVSEIDRIAVQTDFNGLKLLDGSFVSKDFQIGSKQGQTITMDTITSARTSSLGSYQGFSLAGVTIGVASDVAAAKTVAVGGVTTALGTIANDAKAVAAAINASNVSGLSASANATAVAAVTSNITASANGTSTLTVNGIAISVVGTGVAATNRANTVSALNAQSSVTGVVATDTGAGVALTAADGRNIKVVFAAGGNTDATEADFGLAAAGTTGATINVNYSAPTGTSGNLVFTGTLTSNLTNAIAATGTATSAIDISTLTGATTALTSIDNALTTISSTRASLGAYQNRFSMAVSNLESYSTNLSASRSRILDTDYAKETTNLAKSQIIQQAATAMLAQANQSGQSVLALLK
jgi:flagellin